MPAARTAATPAKLAPSAVESSTATSRGRVKLSKALAAKPTRKSAGTATPGGQKKPDGAKPKKFKLRSSRYKIPDNEYAQLTALKKRLLTLGVSARKSELLRAGLMLLVALDDPQLKKAIAKVDLVKTGLPPNRTN